MFILRTLYEKYCINENQQIFACFIDFRKAFDSIWHEALFLKLLKLGIGGPFYTILKQMYFNVTASVKCGNTLSESFNIFRGVKQGDILSPLLFNIFINDMVTLFNETDGLPPSLIDKKVGSLLYADDLVILSTSKEGLQNSLNKLSNYCTKWKLAINYDKSKMMCFSKQGKLIKEQFTIQGKSVEQVKSYTYLGVEIKNSGSFNLAQKSLTNKAMKALFKLKNLLSGSNLKAHICLKLFDQLIKPICLYAAEIWGIFEFKIPSVLGVIGKLEASLENVLCEKLNTSFAKFVLGVHKKAQNTAVRGELGRYPIAIDIITATQNYLRHIENSGEGSLLNEALRVTKNITSSKKSWGYLSKNLIDHIKASSDLDCSTVLSKVHIKQITRSNYVNFWKNKITNERKMRTYNTFKSDFAYEDYLDMSNQKHCRALARLRISAHRLQIERGRYTTPLTPAEHRLCKKCALTEIEDEFHLLMKCTNYTTLRQIFFMKVYELCPNAKTLDDKNKFLYIMSAGEDIFKHLSAFVYEAFQIRESVV